ncbi:DNA-directed RNA polymerase subunit [Citrus sinensis]|nr:DNA-directed RNA polymerase subunit [Citrus sinensis]
MEFCPTCGTMLQYELPHMDSPSRFSCPACPYVCNMESRVKIKRKQPLSKKEIQPIFTQDAMMEGPQTEVTCPACKHGKAVYHELQTRSADEPMSIFYMCANKNCKHRWNE